MITRPRSRRRIRRTLHFDLESLDDRIVPSTIGAALPANVGSKLRLVYAQYMTFVGAAAGGAIAPTQVSQAVVSSAQVGVNVHTTDTAHFRGFLEQLRGAGLQVTRASAASGDVSGIVPIVSLPAVANSSPASIVTLPTNMDWRLQSLHVQYQAFVNAGGQGAFSPTGFEGVRINGTNVDVKVTTIDGRQFTSILADLERDGLRVTGSSLLDGVIVGKLPIAQLSTVAKISPMVTIRPLFKPPLR